jgi:AcrR family transcriptional regulator
MTGSVSHSLESKEAKILASASRLFERFGPKKTTIDDIARAAGLGKGTIYLYFKSKDEIFLTVVRHEMAGLLAKVRAALAEGGSCEECLRRYMSVRFGHLEEVLARFGKRVDIVQDSHEQPGMERLRNDYVRAEADLVRGMIEEGIARGELACAEPALASTAIVMMMFACCLDWLHHGRALPPADKVDVMTRLILHGLLHR